MKLNTIQHNQFSLEKLIKLYQPYFLKMTSNFTINEYTKECLIAEANVSLWQSNLTFDKTKNDNFSSYLQIQAKFAMLNYLNQKATSSSTIFIPILQKENYNISTVSINTPIYDNKTISDTIPNEMEEDIDESKIVALKQHLAKLNKKQRDIIEIKYLQGCSDSEISEMTGTTKQYIGQVVNKSIKFLQKEFGVPQLGQICKKHTKTKDKERQLREKHNVV